MPELPEVEVTRRGLAPQLAGRVISGVEVREARLRWPIGADVRSLAGRTVKAVHRRGKYLLVDCGDGHLILHLGMSGSLRVLAPGTPAGKHDHFDLLLGDRILRLRDPRRFGAVLFQPGEAMRHKLLHGLGPEPLERQFTADWMYQRTRGRTAPIKSVLMDNRMVCGVGNIYANESLFRAGIHPARHAGRISRARYQKLVEAVRVTLRAAIRAGGSSLRDFVHADGSSGYFQQKYFVYGREGEKCKVCGAKIKSVRIGQRSAFYCSRCQR